MRALTVWQPWATLIALGLKRVETRGWATPHRGPLAIHAAARLLGKVGDVHEFTPDRYSTPIVTRRTRDGMTLERGGHPPIDLPFGAVVALSVLRDVVRTDGLALTGLERSLGDYTPGRYAWQLSSVEALLRPEAAKGAQQLWEWPVPDHVRAVSDLLDSP